MTTLLLGRRCHTLRPQGSELSWKSAGVISAVDKHVSGSLLAQELGAEIDGNFGQISGGLGRIFRAVQGSLGVLKDRVSDRKLLQILGGRWAFIVQFRRPLFAALNEIWRWVYSIHWNQALLRTALCEIFFLLCLSPLAVGNLRRQISNIATASHASERGGASGHHCG